MPGVIATPEGRVMPLNSVQGGFADRRYCVYGHRYDGLNYPTPGGGCTACLLKAEGKRLPVPGIEPEDLVSNPLPEAIAQASVSSSPVLLG